MDHAYLAALMKGEISVGKKSTQKSEQAKIKLHADMEKELDRYIDGMQFEEDYISNALLSANSKRQKLKYEMKEAAKLTKLSQHIESALSLLFSDGSQYLEPELFDKLKKEFNEAATTLSNLKLQSLGDSDLQKLANLSDETLQSIAKIAIAKFAENKFLDCLSLFVLLSNLKPNNGDFWFRQGIAAQKCNDFELALNSYEAAAEIDPSVGAKLLAADCCIKTNQIDVAKARFSAAKELAGKGEIEPIWQELIASLEDQLQTNS